jgi:F-type H+/Na+-transporting ATPase subunit alpha
MSNQTLKQFFSSFDAAIQSVESQSDKKEAGVIRSVKDGVLHVYGLLGLKMGEVIRVEDSGVEALVMQLEGRNTYAVQLQASLEVAEGQSVVSTGTFLGVTVGEKWLGRVVDPLGRD